MKEEGAEEKMRNKKILLFNLSQLESDLNSLESFLVINAGLLKNNVIPNNIVQKKLKIHVYEFHQRLTDLILSCQNERKTKQSILHHFKKILVSIVKLQRYLNSKMNTQNMYKVSKKEISKIDHVITELRLIKIT